MGRKGENSAYFQDGRGRTGFHYALVPTEVMKSQSYKASPDYAKSALFALAAGFRKVNNGDLSLTGKQAEELGIRSEWRRRAGLKILELVGLVETTRVGRIEAGKGICSLYALGWRQIDPSAKYDTPTVMATRAPNRWASWTQPDDWQIQVRKMERDIRGGKRTSWEDVKNSHTPRGAQVDTHVGRRNGNSRNSRGAQETPVPDTHVGVPFQSLASRARPKPLGQRLADSNLDGLIRVARANPTFTPAELAKVCKVPVDAIHRALQAMQAQSSGVHP